MKRFVISCLLVIFASGSAFAAESAFQAMINDALSSGRPSLVDFGAGKCIPCKKMKPILDSLRKEYDGRANVVFIDVWIDNDIGGKYKVQMIPTQIFYDAKGKEVKRHMGFMDRPDILKVFKELGVR